MQKNKNQKSLWLIWYLPNFLPKLDGQPLSPELRQEFENNLGGIITQYLVKAGLRHPKLKECLENDISESQNREEFQGKYNSEGYQRDINSGAEKVSNPLYYCSMRFFNTSTVIMRDRETIIKCKNNEKAVEKMNGLNDLKRYFDDTFLPKYQEVHKGTAEDEAMTTFRRLMREHPFVMCDPEHNTLETALRQPERCAELEQPLRGKVYEFLNLNYVYDNKNQLAKYKEQRSRVESVLPKDEKVRVSKSSKSASRSAELGNEAKSEGAKPPLLKRMTKLFERETKSEGALGDDLPEKKTRPTRIRKEPAEEERLGGHPTVSVKLADLEPGREVPGSRKPQLSRTRTQLSNANPAPTIPLTRTKTSVSLGQTTTTKEEAAVRYQDVGPRDLKRLKVEIDKFAPPEDVIRSMPVQPDPTPSPVAQPAQATDRLDDLKKSGSRSERNPDKPKRSSWSEEVEDRKKQQKDKKRDGPT